MERQENFVAIDRIAECAGDRYTNEHFTLGGFGDDYKGTRFPISPLWVGDRGCDNCAFLQLLHSSEQFVSEQFVVLGFKPALWRGIRFGKLTKLIVG